MEFTCFFLTRDINRVIMAAPRPHAIRPGHGDSDMGPFMLEINPITVGMVAGSRVLLAGTGTWSATSSAFRWNLPRGWGFGGTVSALIQFSYAPNPKPAPLSGTLPIAGLSLPVTQTGNSFVAASPVTALVSGGLNGPAGVALHSSGNVYIADHASSASEQKGHKAKEWSLGSQLLNTLV